MNQLFPRQQGGDPSLYSCPDSAKPAIYHYKPNAFAAYLLLALLGLTTVIHTYQVLRTRTWFWTAFLFGGILEIVGFIGRILNVNEAPCFEITTYIVMSMGTLLAPCFFAASIYMGFGRIMVLAQGEHLSIVRTNWITKIFVLGDVISIMAQGAGGGFQSSDKPGRADLGNTILIVGLWIQIVFFGLFMINSIIWWTRMRGASTPVSHAVPWEKHLTVFFVASFLIAIRSIFRVIEYMQGRNGYLISHEIFFYILDIALMFLLMTGFHYWHPSEVTALCQGKNYVKLLRLYDGTSRNNDYMMLSRESESYKLSV